MNKKSVFIVAARLLKKMGSKTKSSSSNAMPAKRTFSEARVWIPDSSGTNM
jgi:hypothetical protein